MSEKVDWAYWSKLPEVKVFEALALLEGQEPKPAPPESDEATPQYSKTLRLLLACLSDRSFFTPGSLNMSDPALHGVRLREVGKWATANGYTLPEKFPRPVQVPKAPPPIEPLRGTGYVPSPRPSAANWNKWKFIPKAPLWEAVCLTLDVEPNDEVLGMRHWLQSRRGVPRGLPPEFVDRLQVAQANMSTNGPLRPLALYSGVLQNPHAEVSLSELAAFAVRCGWTVPDAMQSMTPTLPPVAKGELAAMNRADLTPPTDEDKATAGKVWTEQRKAEARAYRDKHGLKKTAEHYGVSQAIISRHIPAGKVTEKVLSPWRGLGKK